MKRLRRFFCENANAGLFSLMSLADDVCAIVLTPAAQADRAGALVFPQARAWGYRLLPAARTMGTLV
jgi:hypothetical protein